MQKSKQNYHICLLYFFFLIQIVNFILYFNKTKIIVSGYIRYTYPLVFGTLGALGEHLKDRFDLIIVLSRLNREYKNCLHFTVVQGNYLLYTTFI